MPKVYFTEQPEGVEIDCSQCGSTAIQNDTGTFCGNPDCPSNK